MADIFDALVSDRPYRRGLSLEEALTMLRDGAGRRFDDRAVDALDAAVAEGWCPMVPEGRPRPDGSNALDQEVLT